MIKVGAAIICLALVFGFAYLFGPALVHSWNQRPFEPDTWRAGDAEIRGSMVRDLEANNRLLGLSKTTVFELLGEPDREQQDVLTYTVDLGYRFGSAPWLYSFDVVLDSTGHVSRCYHHD